MSIELSKGRKTLLLISVFLTSIAVMGEMGVMPLVYDIYGAYDNMMAVNFIVSGSALFVVLGSLLSTFLMGRYEKKWLLVVFSAIFCVSAIFCTAVDNLYFICMMRALMGFGEGSVNAVIMAYIAQLFLDENKRASFMGYYNASMTLFAIVMSYVSGVLASSGWKNAFNLYWPSVLMIVGLVLFAPSLGQMEEGNTQTQIVPQEKRNLLAKCTGFSLLHIFCLPGCTVWVIIIFPLM